MNSLRECPVHGGICRVCPKGCRDEQPLLNPLVFLLEARRKEAGLSATKLSARAGYAKDYWSAAVRGQFVPTVTAFCDHAQALGYSFRLMRDA